MLDRYYSSPSQLAKASAPNSFHCLNEPFHMPVRLMGAAVQLVCWTGTLLWQTLRNTAVVTMPNCVKMNSSPVAASEPHAPTERNAYHVNLVHDLNSLSASSVSLCTPRPIIINGPHRRAAADHHQQHSLPSSSSQFRSDTVIWPLPSSAAASSDVNYEVIERETPIPRLRLHRNDNRDSQNNQIRPKKISESAPGTQRQQSKDRPLDRSTLMRSEGGARKKSSSEPLPQQPQHPNLDRSLPDVPVGNQPLPALARGSPGSDHQSISDDGRTSCGSTSSCEYQG